MLLSVFSSSSCCHYKAILYVCVSSCESPLLFFKFGFSLYCHASIDLTSKGNSVCLVYICRTGSSRTSSPLANIWTGEKCHPKTFRYGLTFRVDVVSERMSEIPNKKLCNLLHYSHKLWHSHKCNLDQDLYIGSILAPVIALLLVRHYIHFKMVIYIINKGHIFQMCIVNIYKIEFYNFQLKCLFQIKLAASN